MTTLHFDLHTFLDPSFTARDVPDGKPHVPWRLRVLSVDEFDRLSSSPDRMSEEQLLYLAWLNSLAPTSHNTMPQRFRLNPEENTLEIWIDRKFVLSASDEKGREALVSVGCGIANTVLGARCYGRQAHVTLGTGLVERVRPAADGEPRYVETARVRFDRGGEQLDHAWLEAMRARKVVRAEYDERVKLDSTLVDRMRAVVAPYAGLELHVLTDAPTLLFLGKFQEIADSTAFNRDAFAVELGEWLLDNRDESCLGMRGIEFGLNDEVSRHVHEGLLRVQRLLPDEIAGMAKAGYLGMRSSSAVSVITAEHDSPALRIDAGRAYEELALLLEQNRFCTAMHAAIVEFEPANLSLRARLRTRWRPTVLFRIGRPLDERDGHRPHAARPTLESLLLPNEAASA